MNKQNKKSKNQVSTESLFKPIIATSLAVALGVSVSVGAESILDKETVFTGTSTLGGVEFNKDNMTTTTPNSKGALVFKSGATLILKAANSAANITNTGIDLSGNSTGVTSVYGIYMEGGNAIKTSDAAGGSTTTQTIAIDALKAGKGGEAVGFNLKGGNATLGKGLAITFAGVTGATAAAQGNGLTATGIRLSSGTLTNDGTITFTGAITAGSGTSTAAEGGEAVGLDLGGGTLTNNGTITFANITGGNASDGNGTKGSATGIRNGTIQGGTIALGGTIAAGTTGKGDTGSAYAIDGVTLTDATVNVSSAAGTSSGLVGIFHNGAATLKYKGAITVKSEEITKTALSTYSVNNVIGLDLQTGADLSELTKLDVIGASGENKVNGATATGIKAKVSTLEASKFGSGSTFTVKGGSGYGTGHSGGIATGIDLDIDAVTTVTKSLTFASIKGGNGHCGDTLGGTCPGNGGNAVGIGVAGANNLTFGESTLTFQEVLGGNAGAGAGSSAGKAFIINNANNKNITFAENSHINVKTTTDTTPGRSIIINHAQGTGFSDLVQKGGIYNFLGGTITFGATTTAVNDTKGTDITAMKISGAAALNATATVAIQTKAGGDGSAAGKEGQAGGAATGIELSGGTLLSNVTGATGNLKIIAGNGGNANGQNATTNNGLNGGNGGNATGLLLSGDSSFAGTLTFQNITAGSGGNATLKNAGNTPEGTSNGIVGKGGSAYGIEGSGKISSEGKEAISSTIGANLIFTESTAGEALKAGSSGTLDGNIDPTKAGSAYLIHTNSSLTFDGVSVIADGKTNSTDGNAVSTTTYGLYHENIGKIGSGTVGATPQYKGTIAFNNVVNAGDRSAIGLDLKDGIDLSEATLSFGDIKRVAATGVTNTNATAIGMQMKANTGITSEKKELTFNSVTSEVGQAIGLKILEVTNTTTDLMGYTLSFGKINGLNSDAYAIYNANSTSDATYNKYSLLLDGTTTLTFGDVKPSSNPAIISHIGTDGRYQFSTTANGTAIDQQNSTMINLGEGKNIALSFEGIGTSGIGGKLDIGGIQVDNEVIALNIKGKTGGTPARAVNTLTLDNKGENMISINANRDFANTDWSGKADAIGINASGTFALGGILTFASITSGTANASNAIGLQASGDTTIIGANNKIGQIVFSKLEANSENNCCTPPSQGDGKDEKGSIYVIKNGQGTLTLDNVGVVAGTSLTGNANELSTDNTFFGIYHGIANARYDFGKETIISIANLKPSLAASAPEKNVIGLAVASNLELSGKLIFKGLKNESANTTSHIKDAALGVYIKNGAKLTLSKNAELASNDISANGDVYGIYIDNSATLDISKITSADKKVKIDFKGLDSAAQAYGLLLKSDTSKINSEITTVDGTVDTGNQLDITAQGQYNIAALGTTDGLTGSITLKATSVKGNAAAIKTNEDQAATIGAGSTITVLGVGTEDNSKKAYVIDASSMTSPSNVLTIAGDKAVVPGVSPFVKHAQIIAGATIPTDTDFAIYHGIENAGAGYAGKIEVGDFAVTKGAATGMIIAADTFVDQDSNITFRNNAGISLTGVDSATGLKLKGAKLNLATNSKIAFSGAITTASTDTTKKGQAYGIQSSAISAIEGNGAISFSGFPGGNEQEYDDNHKEWRYERSGIVIDNTGTLTIQEGVKLIGGDGTSLTSTLNVNQNGLVYNFGEGENKTVIRTKDDTVLDTVNPQDFEAFNGNGNAYLSGNLEVIGNTEIDNSKNIDIGGRSVVGFKKFARLNGTEKFVYTLRGGNSSLENGGHATGIVSYLDGKPAEVATVNYGPLFGGKQAFDTTFEIYGGSGAKVGGDATAIKVENSLEINGGKMTFRALQAGKAKTKGQAYALDIADGKYFKANGFSLVYSKNAPDVTEAFGIYHGIDSKYRIGDAATATMEVNVNDTNKAIGLVLAANAEFTGFVNSKAVFNVDGNNAEGLKITGKGVSIDSKIGDNNVNFVVGRNAIEGSEAVATGISSTGGVKFVGHKLGFDIGNMYHKEATGIALQDGSSFAGQVGFNSITTRAKGQVRGIQVNGNSYMKSEAVDAKNKKTNTEISFDESVFARNSYETTPVVLNNDGTFTIHKGAAIVAGVTNAKNNDSTKGIFATINNNLADVEYKLGNLRLVLNNVEDLGSDGKQPLVLDDTIGIRSTQLSANFIVDGGDKTLRIEGGNYGDYTKFKAQRAFDGGGLNLILKNGAKVELGVDGGTIARLEAGSTSTINLAGVASRTKDTDGIFYRKLTINELATGATTGTPATFANQTANGPVGNGVNFRVLASRSGVDGALKSQVRDFNPNSPKSITGKTGYAYNADGSIYTMKKEIAGYEHNELGNLVFDEFGNAIPVYKEVYSLNQGGSDRIVIDNTTGDTVEKVDATLQVGVRGVEHNEKDNAPKYVVLAEVKNKWVGGEQLKDVVTFNGLKKDGERKLVQGVKDDFDVITIEIARKDIQRDGLETKKVKFNKQISDGHGGFVDSVQTTTVTEDWSDVGAVYYSDLRARDREINNTLADASLSLINTNYMLMSANLNSLNKRLGELRNTDNSQGLWGRLFAGQQSADFGMKQTTTYLTFQVGYDYNFKVGNGTNYVGAAISYISGSSTQDRADFSFDPFAKTLANASAKTDGFEAALYNTYVAENGFYSDSIFKVGYSMSNLNVPSQAQTYDVDNYSIALSEEVGYKVTLGSSNEWNITPQVEFAYAFINDANFTQNIGNSWMNASQDAAHMLRTRVGVNWAYSFDHLADEEKGIKAGLYVGTYYAYDANFGGKTNLRTNSNTTKSYDALKSNGRFVLNVGTDVSIQDATKFYVDFEKSFGGTLQTDYQFSVGVRYGFGAKNSEVKKDGDDKKAAPLKIKDEEQE